MGFIGTTAISPSRLSSPSVAMRLRSSPASSELTAEDCDYRVDPGVNHSLFGRVVVRLSPDPAVDSLLSQLTSVPEDLYGAQFYAGCHHT